MLLEQKKIYAGKIVDLVVDQIEIKGAECIREVVRHPGGVVVLAELADGRIPFVRQLRYPMQKELLELPAGKLDPGEDPAAAAGRELEEETGFRAADLEHLLSFYSTPGFCDEILHLYYSSRLTEVGANPEFDEEVSVELYSLDEAIDLSRTGQILDAKTLVALFWLYWKRSWSLENVGV